MLEGLALARILDIVLAAVRDVVQHITLDDCDDPEFPTSFRLQRTKMATGSCDALNVTHCYKNLHLKPCCTDAEDAQPLCKVCHSFSPLVVSMVFLSPFVIISSNEEVS